MVELGKVEETGSRSGGWEGNQLTGGREVLGRHQRTQCRAEVDHSVKVPAT